MKAYLSGILILLLAGCNSVGPKTIRGARFGYNEAIARSWNEQLLLNLVRLQYRDTPLFLEVTSITARYTMGYNAGASVSSADADDTMKGLTTAAGAVTGRSFSRGDSDSDSARADLGLFFQEEPTITYTPLQGKKFAQQLLTPIAPDAILLLSQSGWSIARVMRLCVQELNGVYNAPSASGPTPEYVPQYKEFNELTNVLRKLQMARNVELGVITREDGPPLIEFHFRTGPETEPDIAFLTRLLTPGKEPGKLPDTMVFTQNYELGKQEDGILRLRTRSMLGVLHYLSQAVEVPKRHRDKGYVTITRNDDEAKTVFDWSTVFKWSEEGTGSLMRIRSSDTLPLRAHVRVHYRGTWFYIDDTDLDSKSTFQLLTNLISLQAGEINEKGPLRFIAL